MGKYMIGMDVGTSVVKVLLYDENGNEVSMVKDKLQHFSPEPLQMEIDMQESANTVVGAIAKIVKDNGLKPDEVQAISLTGQAEGLWPVGFDGKCLGNAIMWSDSRAHKEATEYLIDMEKLQRIYEISGGFTTPGGVSAVLMWLKKNDLDRYNKIKWIGTCSNWIKYFLTDEMTMECTYPADLFDTHTLEISDELLEIYDIKEVKDKLPPLRTALDNFSPLSESMAKELGLQQGIPVFAVSHDMILCQIGSGLIRTDQMSCVVGTSNNNGFLQETSDVMPLVPSIQRGYVIPGKWTKMSGISTATPNIEWAIKNIGSSYVAEAEEKNCSVFDVIEEHIRKIPLGCEGVVYHPHISPAGERAPSNPFARAQFTGICLEHSTDHMMRAVYEGVGYGIFYSIKSLGDRKINEVRLSGGGASSEFLSQMIADMVGVEVVTVEKNELGTNGTVIVASVALGKYKNFEEAIEKTVLIKKRFKPNMENHKKYESMFKLYNEISENATSYWQLRDEIMKTL